MFYWVRGVSASHRLLTTAQPLACPLQVECNPSGNITLDIDQYRANEGGYIRLAVEQVAGDAAVQAVELRRSPVAVGRPQ